MSAVLRAFISTESRNWNAYLCQTRLSQYPRTGVVSEMLNDKIITTA